MLLSDICEKYKCPHYKQKVIGPEVIKQCYYSDGVHQDRTQGYVDHVLDKITNIKEGECIHYKKIHTYKKLVNL